MIDTTPKKQMSADNIIDTIKGEDAVLLFYHAEWSGPCNHAKDILGMDEIKPKLIPIDVDDSPDWMKTVGDRPTTGGVSGMLGVPAFEYYKGGKLVDTMIGITSIADLNNFINESEVNYEGCSDFGEGDT